MTLQQANRQRGLQIYNQVCKQLDKETEQPLPHSKIFLQMQTELAELEKAHPEHFGGLHLRTVLNIMTSKVSVDQQALNMPCQLSDLITTLGHQLQARPRPNLTRDMVRAYIKIVERSTHQCRQELIDPESFVSRRQLKLAVLVQQALAPSSVD